MFQPDPRTSSSLHDHGGFENSLVIQTIWSTKENPHKRSLSHSSLAKKPIPLDPISFTIGQSYDTQELGTSSPFHYVLPTFMSEVHHPQQMGIFVPGGKEQTMNNLRQTLEQYNIPLPNTEPVISTQDKNLDLAYPDDDTMLCTEEEEQITPKSFAPPASPALSFHTDEGFCSATPSPEIPETSVRFTTNQRTDKPGGLSYTQAPSSLSQQLSSRPPVRNEEERQTPPQPVFPLSNPKAPFKQTSPGCSSHNPPDIPRARYYHARISKRKVPPSHPGSPQPDFKRSKPNPASVPQPSLEAGSSHVTSTTIPGEGKGISDRPSKSVRIDPFLQIHTIPRIPSPCNSPSPLPPVTPLASEAVTLTTEPPIAVLQESDDGFVTEMSHLDLTSHPPPPSTATDDDSASVDELANDAPPPPPQRRQSKILQSVRSWTQQLSGIAEAGMAGKVKEQQRSSLSRVLPVIRTACKNSLITVEMLDLTGLDEAVVKFADKRKSVQSMDGTTVDVAKKIGTYFASLRAAAAEK